MSNKTQIFVNDEEIDLSADSPIALTYQINDLAEVKNQQGNISNQFQIPDTQNNRRILGFPNNVNFNDPLKVTQLPYTQYKVRIIQHGIEILPNAIMELGDPAYDTDVFNCQVLSGNADFFELIGGQLSDMGDSKSQWSKYGANLVWKPYDHIWNLQNVANSQKNTSDSGNNGLGGWIYPIVDYGLFTEDFTQPIDVRYMRPGFFIKTAIDLMLKLTGYKAKGSLLKNPLYPKLIAQFSNGSWEHGTDYQNAPDDRGAIVQKNTTTVLDTESGYITWETIASDPSNQMSPGHELFVSKAINDVKVTVTIPHVYIRGRVTPPDRMSSVTIGIYYRDPNFPTTPDYLAATTEISFASFGEDRGPGDPTSDPKGWRRIPHTSGSFILAELDVYNLTVSWTDQLPAGGGVFVGWLWSNQNIISGYNAYGEIKSGIKMTIVSQKQNVDFGQEVQCERIFPDVSQKDLIKDTLQRFGIICQTDSYSKTITFASLGDIVSNIPLAKDWSSKLLNQGRQVSLKLGNYSQVNYLEYQVDSNAGSTTIPLKYAWSKININNYTLSPIASDLIVSIFGASLNRPYYGGSIAQIQMIDPTDDSKAFSIPVAPRILIDQKLDLMAINKTVTFTDGVNNVVINDVISTPYFIKPGVPDDMNLDWEKLRLLYYPQLEKILKNCKKVSLYFMLTPKDISEIDHLIPIYLEQDSSYYYINKINDWVAEKPVKIELVKLG